MPRLYIGNLPRKVEERDIKKFFNEFGRIRCIDLKNGYGFVEFEDKRDAEDAVHDLDGSKMLGERVTVEMARSSARFGGNGGSGGGGGGNNNSKFGRFDGHDSRDNNSRRPIRSEHRVIVEELSTRVSWQDLKDLMRKVGEVTFADAHKLRKNEGVVEFSNHSDMKTAISKYDGYELHGYKLRVYEDRKNGFKKRSKSRSRRRSSSKSRSRTRSRSHGKQSSSRRRSRSVKRSGSRKRSGSPKRSRSRKRSPSKSRSTSGNGFLKSKSASRKRSASVKKSPRSKSGSSTHEKSPKPKVSRSRSRSRSSEPANDKREVSKSPAKADNRSKSRSMSKSRSQSRSVSKSRSKSPQENGSPKSGSSDMEKPNAALEAQENNETMDSN